MTPEQVAVGQYVAGGGGFALLLYQLWPMIQRYLLRATPMAASTHALSVDCVLELAEQLEAKNHADLANQLRKLPAEVFREVE